MKREEAIHIVKTTKDWSELREALAVLVPELAESEDERIRKALVKQFGGCIKDHKFCHTGFTYGEITAWLEKQKEQKPIQSDDEKEYVRVLKSLISDFIRDNYKTTDISFYQKIYDWLDGRHIEQKPHRFCDDTLKAIDKAREFDEQEQKPAWSEEDEEMLEYIIGDVNDAKQLYKTQEAKDMADKEIAWLKSLRPSWKPSEEQLKELNFARLGRTPNVVHEHLDSLYNDLLKLK